MKRILNKYMIVLLIITLLLFAAGFAYGYFSYDCGDFLCISSPAGDGVVNVIILAIIMSIIGCKYLSKKVPQLKRESKRFYLIFIVLIIAIIISNIKLYDYYKDIKHHQMLLTLEAVSDEIEIFYTGEFVNSYDEGWGIYRLRGYTFDSMPDIDNDMSNWKTIMSTDALKKYKNPFAIYYFFGNSHRPFATFNTNDYIVEYSYDGLSIDMVQNINSDIEKYISNIYDSYSVNIRTYKTVKYEESAYAPYVIINKKISSSSLQSEEEIWKRFINQYNLDTRFVDLIVYYYDEDILEAEYHVSTSNWVWEQV